MAAVTKGNCAFPACLLTLTYLRSLKGEYSFPIRYTDVQRSHFTVVSGSLGRCSPKTCLVGKLLASAPAVLLADFCCDCPDQMELICKVSEISANVSRLCPITGN